MKKLINMRRWFDRCRRARLLRRIVVRKWSVGRKSGRRPFRRCQLGGAGSAPLAPPASARQRLRRHDHRFRLLRLRGVGTQQQRPAGSGRKSQRNRRTTAVLGRNASGRRRLATFAHQTSWTALDDVLDAVPLRQRLHKAVRRHLPAYHFIKTESRLWFV